jgi:hypothetical protein
VYNATVYLHHTGTEEIEFAKHEPVELSATILITTLAILMSCIGLLLVIIIGLRAYKRCKKVTISETVMEEAMKLESEKGRGEVELEKEQ